MVIISVILAIAIPVTALYGFGLFDTPYMGTLGSSFTLSCSFFWPRLS